MSLSVPCRDSHRHGLTGGGAGGVTITARTNAQPAARAAYAFTAILVAVSIVFGGLAAGLDAGGSVSNVAPQVSATSCSATSLDNSGKHSQFFAGNISDANGESDMAAGLVEIVISGPVSETLSYTIKTAETSRGSEPSAWGGQGWKVWSGEQAQDGDGILEYKARYQVRTGLPAGTYTVTPRFTPSGGETVVGAVCRFGVSTHTEIDVASEPVGEDGNPLGQNWGMWNATPGQRNVNSTNYIRLRNIGQDPTQEVIVDFSDASLVGRDDARHSIPLNGNIQFAVCEVESVAIPPSACTFDWGATSTTSSLTASFTGLDKVIYVSYRVLEVPAVLRAQGYGAAYTVDLV